MNIRKYLEKDRASLIAFWSKVFPNDPVHNRPSDVIKAKLKVDDLIFILKNDDKILGACMTGYDGHRGWLYAVAVSPEYRRKKIGSKLVRFAIAQLKDIGCIKVNLQIRSTNTEVAAFYKSLGFFTEDRLSMGIFV
jgi:ribosomal protein S18 acetylase RimI-like enzyme